MKRRSGAHVSLVEGRVIKRYSPESVRLEYKRACALWECSVDRGFVTPRPLAVREEDSEIEYEFLPGLVSIRETYAQLLGAGDFDGEAVHCIREVGKVLAHIHQYLNVSPAVAWEMPSAFAKGLKEIGVEQPSTFLANSPHALVHGDYGFSNLYIRRTPELQLVVLDASPNQFTTFAPNERGSIYLDVGHFTACLDGLVPFQLYPWLHWSRLMRVKELFWSAYEQAAGLSLDRKSIACVAYANAYSYFVARFGYGLRARVGMSVLYNRYKDNVP